MAFQRIMLVKFVWMKYYQRQKGDIPVNEMAYFDIVDGVASVAENFTFINYDGMCFSYFQTRGKAPRIEKIKGQVKNLNCKSVDNVLVIFCAPNPSSSSERELNIIGWYENATVYRETYHNKKMDIYYNICAESKNCVLLPETERNNKIWFLQQAVGSQINFGQAAMYKFPSITAPELQDVLQEIENYNGENWCGKFC